MKKIFAFVFSIFVCAFLCVNQCFAEINSVSDIDKKIYALHRLDDFDLSKLYNKSELIGQARENFSRQSSNYNRNIKMTISQLEEIKQNIIDMKEQQQTSNVYSLYLSVDNALFEFDNKTYDFIQNLEKVMPSITYQRFKKKFDVFYNSLNIVDSTKTKK